VRKDARKRLPSKGAENSANRWYFGWHLQTFHGLKLREGFWLKTGRKQEISCNFEEEEGKEDVVREESVGAAGAVDECGSAV
jgi:hypothetical protein